MRVLGPVIFVIYGGGMFAAFGSYYSCDEERSAQECWP